MLTSSPNQRQKDCILPWILSVLFFCIHTLLPRQLPTKYTRQFNFFLSSFLPFYFGFHHWAPMLTLSNINRDGVHLQPNLHKFILSGCPVEPMTLIRHPAHFSQLDIFEQSSVFVRQKRLELWFEVARLIWDEGPVVRAQHVSLHSLQHVKFKNETS